MKNPLPKQGVMIAVITTIHTATMTTMATMTTVTMARTGVDSMTSW